MSFTPGEWGIRYDSHGAAVQGPHGESVAWCGDNYSTETGRVPFRENARLIAAAPDLLAACEHLWTWTTVLQVFAGNRPRELGMYLEGISETIVEANAAIAKARGIE